MITSLTARGTANDKTGTTLAVSPSANIPAGSSVLVVAVSDNVGTADGATTGHAITDTDGHTWTRLREITESSGALGDGVTLSVWKVLATSQIATGDSITLTVTGAGTDPAMAIGLTEVVHTAEQELVLRDATSTQGNGTTPASLSLSSLPNVHMIHLVAAGSGNSNANITHDTDFTSLLTAETTGGVGTSNVEMRLAYDLRTATTTDTYNPTQSPSAPYVTFMLALECVDVAGADDALRLRTRNFAAADANNFDTEGVRFTGDTGVLVVYNGIGGGGDANFPTVTMTGATVTQIATSPSTGADETRRVSMYKLVGTPDLIGTIDIDFAGQTQSFCAWTVADGHGLNAGGGFVVQSNGVHQVVTPNTSYAFTLSAFGDTDNVLLVALMHGGAAPNLNTFEGGMTELHDESNGGESMTVGAAWQVGGDTNPTVSWTNSGHYVGLALELLAEAAFTVWERAATVDANADIDSDGFAIAERAAVLDVVADIVAAPQRDLQRAASLDVSASFDAVGELEPGGSATFEAAASFDATVAWDAAYVRELQRSASVEAVADIETVPGIEGIVFGAASFDALASIEVSAHGYNPFQEWLMVG